MNARTLSGLEAQIAMPTDVSSFIRAAQNDFSGTDYPGALQLGQALAAMLKAEGFLTREILLFSARYVVALEDSGEAAADALFQIEQTLGQIDFKKHW